MSIIQKMESASQEMMVDNLQVQVSHLHVILFTYLMDQLQSLANVMENGTQVFLPVLLVIQ